MTDGKPGRRKAQGKLIKIRISATAEAYLSDLRREWNIAERSAAGGELFERAAQMRLFLPASPQE